MADPIRGEVTELLQQLIRNRCVNLPGAEFGDETKNAETLQSYLQGSGVDMQLYESVPGRASLVARLDGSDPSAPTLLLLGHTDVVPVNADGWTVDPFEGKFDGERVWGRGAIDMLNLTSSMAVALKHLAAGPRPRASIIFAAVADEEAGGSHGAGYLTEHHFDAVKADFVITEWGGIPLPTPTGPKLAVTVGEKGYTSCVLVVKGVPGHASMPLGSDNAIATAGEVLRRLSEYHDVPKISEQWRTFIVGLELEAGLTEALLDPTSFDEAVSQAPYGLAPRMHACAHFTAAPTIIAGGTRSNVIPDTVELTLNVRTLLGQSENDVCAFFADILGELAERVEVKLRTATVATESPTDTPLWDAMQQVSERLVPGARCLPNTTAGGTDAYFFRKRGIPAYGFGLFSEKMTTEAYLKMFHGNDEWVDQDSLVLSTQLWQQLALAL